VVGTVGSPSIGTLGAQFNVPRGAAVNREGHGVAAGTFYVVDSKNSRVQRFGPSGAFVSTWGWGVADGEEEFEICKTAASCREGKSGAAAGEFASLGGQGITVDQATGVVYVADQINHRIDAFSATGSFLGAFGWKVRVVGAAEEFQLCNVGAGCQSGSAGAHAGQFPAPVIGAGLGGMAVAPPGSPNAGNLYVANRVERRVDVFKPTIESNLLAKVEFISGFGWNVKAIGGLEEFQVCTVVSDCKQAGTGSGGANPGQFVASSPTDVAVDSAGNVFAVDAGAHKHIQEFSPTPTVITKEFGTAALSSVFGTGELLNVTVDPTASANHILVSGRRSGSTPANRVAVAELDHNGKNPLEFEAEKAHGEGLTPNQTSGTEAGAGTGLTVAPPSLGGNIYLVTVTAATLEGAYVLNEGPSVEATTGVTAHEAVLHGKVVSQGADVGYHFEYSPDGITWTKLPSSDADAGTESAIADSAATGTSTGTLTVKARGGAFTLTYNGETTGLLPYNASASAVKTALEGLASIGANVTVSGGPGSPDGSTPYTVSFTGPLLGTEVTQITADASSLLAPKIAVTQSASGLQGGTKYLVRLVATRPSGGFAITSTQGEFTTPAPPPVAPAVSAVSASAITSSSAKLEGQVDPEGQATTYQFEYLTQAAYEANSDSFSGPEPAAKAPASPAAIGAGSINVPAVEQVEGLVAETTYRYRLVATNPTGSGEETSTFATQTPSPVFKGECPANESLRAGPSAALPDCRAYEQASPVEKNGGSLQAFTFSTKASVNGDAVSFESAAGIPGGEGSQEFPTYLASRGPGGWSTQGLLPSASSGPTGLVRGWTPDFSQVFDSSSTGTAGGSEALLSRPRDDGAPVEVAPYTSPKPSYRFGGSSNGGSTVLFTGRGALPLRLGSPTPAAGQDNLYAWDRASNQRSLVGVLPDGSVPPAGSTLAGEDGSSGYSQDMHAVSGDGSAYFTAGTPAQLYLRAHPTEEETAQKDGEGNCVPDPVLACTLHVSASQRTDCADHDPCGGTPEPDPGGPLPAAFVGAATDSSSGFFTSQEELTDDAHTTALPNVIGRADISVGAEPPSSVLPSFIPDANADTVAVDSGHIYWADPGEGHAGEGTIGRAKLDGSEVEPEFIPNEVEVSLGVFEKAVDNPQGIAVDGSHVYWSNAGEKAGVFENENTEAGTIGRAKLDGSEVEPGFIEGASYPEGIEVTASYIYWANHGTLGHRGIGRATLDGTTAVNQLFIELNVRPTDIAIDAAHIYIAGGNGSPIQRTNLTGTEITPLPSGAQNALQIAVDSNHLYWTITISESGATSNIARSNLDGTGVETIITAQSPEGIATGGGHLYWGSHPSGRGTDLYRYQAATGALTDIVPDPNDVTGADVKGVLGTSNDGTYVYFVANGALAAGASPGTCEGPLKAVTGSCNLYLWHEDPATNATSITFITRLDAGGGSKQGDFADWVPTANVNLSFSLNFEKTSRVAANGRTVLFRSTRRLTSYDNKGVPEFYRYRVGDPGPVCVSCDPSGAPPVGGATLGSIEPPVLGASRPAAVLSRNLSASGNRIFFETPDALVAGDTNGDGGCPPWGSANQKGFIRACQDVYEWEADETGSCHSKAQNGGCLYLISTGKSPDASFFADADSEGDNVFVFTTSQLVGQDRDGLIDAYDARVGGGLASQNEVAAASCEGESCHGQAPPPPAVQSPGSASFSGSGNVGAKRHPKKSKGHHGKRKHKRHHHRAAKTNRRAS
jgi:hypothetical protein